MDDAIMRVRKYLMEVELRADDLTALLDEITRLRAELEAMTAERDAAYAKSETVAFCHSDDRPRRDNMDWNEGYIDGCRGASYAIRAMKEDK